MSNRKFVNPWSSAVGFVDLGSYEVEGLYYELYCLPEGNAGSKLARCIKSAREWSRDSWQLKDARERREHRRLSREAIEDARYWLGVMRNESTIAIGARFGEDGDYQSASIVSSHKAGITRRVCYGYHGPIKEAIARMGQRGLLTETLFDPTDRVLFKPADKPSSDGACVRQLMQLWQKLGDIPVTDEGYLEEDFESFPAGTDREDVWRWFEAQNPDFVVGEVLQGKFANLIHQPSN